MSVVTLRWPAHDDSSSQQGLERPDPFTVAADLFDPPTPEPNPDREECAADPATFMERHATIEEPDGTVIPLTLWDFQREAIADLHEHGAIIVLKARRLGLSWIVLAYALWLAIFNQGIRILVLCKNERDAAQLLDRIRRMRDRIAVNPRSAHVLDGIDRTDEPDAVTTLGVGRSIVRALVGTPAAARSETAGFVILDEFAFQRGAGEIWRGILPTIEGGGRLAVVSTGNGGEQGSGIGAEFARQWCRAVQGLSKLKPLFFPWHVRPDRDEAWRRDAEADLGDPERFKTEYPEKPADAFLSPDADLIYDSTHLATVARLGREIDQLVAQQRPTGSVSLGIDWGVNTHALLARPMAGGGLYVFREIVDRRGDLEQFVAALVEVLNDVDVRVEYERFDAAEPVVHKSFRRQFRQHTGYNARWLAIPFSKYKQVAIRYARLLARRAHEGHELRRIAISPTGCPELLRQMAVLEWRDADAGRVEKGDDHGPDALLTLTAELAETHYAKQPEG